MAKFIDAQCNVEFPSEATYLDHKKDGHSASTLKGAAIDTPPEPTPPPGVPNDALPSPEFIAAINRIENKDKPATEAPVAPQHPSEVPAAQPVVLTYKYIGECPEHRNPVDTFELDVEKKHFCIAVCPADKKQLLTREVNKL